MRVACGVSLASLLLAGSLYAQNFPFSEFDVHVGRAYPSSPQTFYDYWKAGVTAGGGVGFRWTSDLTILVLGDYSWFFVDKDRYFAGLGLPADGNSISGGTSNIVSGQGLIQYFPREDVTIPIFFLGGLGASYSSVGLARATFSGYTVTQRAIDWMVMSAIAGGGLAYPTKKFDLYVEAEYRRAVLHGTGAHSSFSLLSAGVRVRP